MNEYEVTEQVVLADAVCEAAEVNWSIKATRINWDGCMDGSNAGRF